MRYTFTCSCGKKHPVETSSAGRELTCSCGKTTTLPSMLAMKKLPVWEEPALETAASNVSDSSGGPTRRGVPKAGDSASKKKNSRFMNGSRLGILIVGLVLVAIFGWFFWQTVSRPPQPIAVFQKQRDFVLDGSVVRRDSTPVTEEDFKFYVDIINDENIGLYQLANSALITEENLEEARKANPDVKLGDRLLLHEVKKGQWVEINDWVIDQMTPYMAYEYFDLLKNGPALSDNFYENLEALKTQYRLKSGLYGLLLFLSLMICAVPWFMPKQAATVGAARGSEWKV